MWDQDWGWGGWVAMTIGMAGFWILLALLALAVLRAGREPVARELEPRQILERRLARGEIDVEEYQQRLAAIGQAPR